MKSHRVLLLNQCFYPDHVASSQYLTDLAKGLVRAGHQVSVVASSRGYSDPSVRYPVRENWQGIDIRRIWVPGLGKGSKWRRAVDFGMFWLNAVRILALLRRHDVTVCLTSPPLISSLGALYAVLKGGASVPWIMDLNPDEAIAAGWLKPNGWPVRLMDAFQKWSFRSAATIIALDSFMAARIEAKGVPRKKIRVVPPWSHDDVVTYDPAGRAEFRAAHGLEGKFVVMYSGNHSPCHPLDPLLHAAERLQGDDQLRFLFVGGGSEFAKVQEFAKSRSLGNIVTLPYQPVESLSKSLSAADLHVVVMGEPFVGMIHPCKIYNILRLGLPFLGIGPDQCHLGDISRQVGDPTYARVVSPDDPCQMEEALKSAQSRGALPPSPKLQQLGGLYSQQMMLPQLVQIINDASVRPWNPKVAAPN